VLYPVEKPDEKFVPAAPGFLQPYHEIVGLESVQHKDKLAQIAEILGITDGRNDGEKYDRDTAEGIMAVAEQQDRYGGKSYYKDYQQDGTQPHRGYRL
jgi:hypothetical protein